MGRLLRNKYLLLISSVFAGLLYIPAFMYGYFWLWVFPFIALMTLYLCTVLDGALDSVSGIGDEGKRSWAMSFRLFGVNIIQVAICAFPFILVLLLYTEGAIQSQHASAADQWFYNFALDLFPEKQLPKEINFTDGTVQILLSCVFFTIVSLLSFSVFGYKKAVAARRVIFNAKKEPNERNYRYEGGNYLAYWELSLAGLLSVLIWMGVTEVMKQIPSMEIVYLLIVCCVYVSVLIPVYAMTYFFVLDRKVKR